MGGGVAFALKQAGGNVIENEAIKTCKQQNPQVGDVYITLPVNLMQNIYFTLSQ